MTSDQWMICVLQFNRICWRLSVGGSLKMGIPESFWDIPCNILMLFLSLQNKLQADSIFLHPSTAILYHGKSSSNGSLSDSGISDGGCGSDGGLSERERRLGTLRRLAKQLENALAPGSAALRSIFQRMEAAESELKQLQDTCRELIVRTTAVTHKPPSHGGSSEESEGHKSSGVQKKKSAQRWVSPCNLSHGPRQSDREQLSLSLENLMNLN